MWKLTIGLVAVVCLLEGINEGVARRLTRWPGREELSRPWDRGELQQPIHWSVSLFVTRERTTGGRKQICISPSLMSEYPSRRSVKNQSGYLN